MSHSKKGEWGPAPAIALLIASACSGCCIVGTGCGCEGGEIESSSDGQIQVPDLASWVNEEGTLIGDCPTLCEAMDPYLNYDSTSCTLHAVGAPDPEAIQLASPSGEDGCQDSCQAATLDVTCDFSATAYCEGRRHQSWLSSPAGSGATEVARFLARAASAEAASVTSFARLRDELSAWGAPPSLLERTRRAELDEVRHARWMEVFAREYDGQPVEVPVADHVSRSLVDLAIENAVEGCVHETFAAAIARFQGERAKDRKLAAALRRIARDEAEHAQLAWDLHFHLTPQLNPEEQKRVHLALLEATQRLEAPDESAFLSPDARALLGMPNPQERFLLAVRLGRSLQQVEQAVAC